jgi:hypothetical protein
VRDKKRIAVDKIRSGGVDVEVFYDFRNHNFFFEAPGTRDRESADTFTEVRRRLDQVYEKAEPLAWTPVIFVTLHSSYDEQDHSIRTRQECGASVSFTFRRCELSPRPGRAEIVKRVTFERERERVGGGWSSNNGGPIEREGYLEREHEIDFNAGNPSDYDREARAKTLDRPNSYSNAADVVELPYDDDTWLGLLALKGAVDDLHARVKALIGLADFRDRLRRFALSASIPLLGDGLDGRDGKS